MYSHHTWALSAIVLITLFLFILIANCYRYSASYPFAPWNPLTHRYLPGDRLVGVEVRRRFWCPWRAQHFFVHVMRTHPELRGFVMPEGDGWVVVLGSNLTIVADPSRPQLAIWHLPRRAPIVRGCIR